MTYHIRRECPENSKYVCITRGPNGSQSCIWIPLFGMEHMLIILYTNVVYDDGYLLHVELHWIWFSGFSEEVENVSANQRPDGHRPGKHKLRTGRWYLASCEVSLNSVQTLKKSEVLQSIRGLGVHLSFQICLKKIQTLLKTFISCFWSSFPWIPFSCSRSRKCTSKPIRGQCCVFVFRSKLGRWHWYLVLCEIPLNSVQALQRSRKCICQSEARVTILVFRSTRKTQTW